MQEAPRNAEERAWRQKSAHGIGKAQTENRIIYRNCGEGRGKGCAAEHPERGVETRKHRKAREHAERSFRRQPWSTQKRSAAQC